MCRCCGVADTPERRAEDRRRTVDLNRPAYLERRETGRGRRPEDQQLAAEIEALPKVDVPMPVPATSIDPRKSVGELQAEYDGLEARLTDRLQRLQQLPEAEFQAAQVRDEVSLIACSAQLRRLADEIKKRSSSRES